MPLEQAVLDHRVVGGVAATDGMAAQIDVVVVAARRDMIEATLKPLRDAGLEPIGVDLSAFGLIRALGQSAAVAPTDESGDSPDPVASATLYCNVGDVTNLAIAKGRSCLFTRVSPTGLESVATSLAADHRPDPGTRPHVGGPRRPWPFRSSRSRETPAPSPGPARRSKPVPPRSSTRSGSRSTSTAPRSRRCRSSASSSAVPAAPCPASPSGWRRCSACRSRSAGPKPWPALDPAAAARLTLPYGLALDN